MLKEMSLKVLCASYMLTSAFYRYIYFLSQDEFTESDFVVFTCYLFFSIRANMMNGCVTCMHEEKSHQEIEKKGEDEANEENLSDYTLFVTLLKQK